MSYDAVRFEGEGDDRKEIKEHKTEKINAASAFWKRSKNEIKPEEYAEFYKTLSHDYEEPMLWIHTQAEGTLDYSTLFYIPKKAPMDLFRADYTPGVKLYVKRVFITDDEKELLPTYLRFVRGIIDSEDLPLNVSREILQQNKVLAKIKTNSVKKILSEISDLAKDETKYIEFYREFGRPIKEGIYQDYENKDLLMSLVRFKSTKVDGYTSFVDYISRMKTEQKSIYFITGTNESALRSSPLLEMYRDKDIEVLIMDDDIDEIVIPTVGTFKEFELKSVNRSDAAEDLKSEADKKEEKAIDPLVGRIKTVLGDKVKDVKASVRLSGSPSCITADSNDPTAQMQALLKAMGQDHMHEAKPILEINPNHAIIKKMETMADGEFFADSCLVLFEQALLIEGVALANPADFVRRLNTLMEKAL
jgi:molecular chaperone HtpG